MVHVIVSKPGAPIPMDFDTVCVDITRGRHIAYLGIGSNLGDKEATGYKASKMKAGMPGFTHLQKAQPVTFAHHVGAYMEMFKRDYSRMNDIYTRMNYCPLGAGALAGTTYPLDRNLTASLLDFAGPTLNSMDSVSDRDYVIEMLSAFSTIMMHLSRFSEEIIIWNSNEYQFVELDDAYSTGSSIMPQKKNPDIAELVRGKTGRVYGALMSILTTMKGIPLAYNRICRRTRSLPSMQSTRSKDVSLCSQV